MEVIKLENIHFSYNNGRKVFGGLHFALKEGEKIGITGPNGAGKTTLLQIIMGLLKPQAGNILIFGQERKTEADFYDVRRQIGYMFQDADDQLFCPTVEEDVAFGPLNFGWSKEKVRKKVNEVLSILELEKFAKRVTYKLSAGEKRMVALATLLVMEPKILLLDEPTSDLDDKNVEKLVSILHNFSGSCIVVSHNEDFLKMVTTKYYLLQDSTLLVQGG